MPPKRKRNDEPAANTAASSTRATRSSIRTSNTEGASSSKATIKKSKDGNQSDLEAAPPAKKTKATKALTKATTSASKTSKTTAANKTVASSSKTAEARSRQKSGAEKQTKSDDDVKLQKNTVPGTKTSTTSNEPPPLPAKVQSSSNEPYSAERARALFKKYEDSDEPNTIGADGFARLCNDAQMTMEGALPLILAWQFRTKEMMKITEEEWRKGTGCLKVSKLSILSMAVRDLEDLLILDKPVLPKKSKKDVYDKAAYWKYSQDRKASFNQLYMFCFTLVKPAESKNIDMETATALWSVLLVPKYPLMVEVVGFIGDHPTTYRAANKDLWRMMMEFCETVNPNLSDYESDGAWPTLLDNFVAWKKGQSMNDDASS